MRLIEKFHSHKNKVFQYKNFTDPEKFKKHKYYDKIKDRIEDALSKGFTFGPVIHYGFDLESENKTNDFNDIIDKSHHGAYGYGGVGGAPGGIFFSVAEGNDPNFYSDLTDDNTYKNDPFSSRYFARSMGVSTGGIVCMLKATKYCDLRPYIKKGILDDEFMGYIVDESHFYILKRLLRKIYPKASSEQIEEIFNIIEEYCIIENDGYIPTFLSGSFDNIFQLINNHLKNYINLIDKNFYNFIKTENINKAQTFILNAYGYDPVIDVCGEIICYDMNNIYVCGKTSDTDFLKKWDFDDRELYDKWKNKGY